MHDVADHFNYANVIYPYEVGSRLVAETLREPLLNQVWNVSKGTAVVPFRPYPVSHFISLVCSSRNF